MAKVGAKEYGVEMGRTREVVAKMAVELSEVGPDDAGRWSPGTRTV